VDHDVHKDHLLFPPSLLPFLLSLPKSGENRGRGERELLLGRYTHTQTYFLLLLLLTTPNIF
jgi:hypothetical protein